MVLSSPFRLPPPEPRPFHEALISTFDDYDQNAIALEEEEQTTGKRFTFGQVRQLAASVAYSLRDRYGFRKGDTVLSFVENRIEFPILFLGVSALGGITSGVNLSYTHEEVAKQTADSAVKYIVTSEQWLPAVLRALDGLNNAQYIRAIFFIDPTSKLDSSRTIVPLHPFDDLYRASVPQRNDGRPVFPTIQIDPKKDLILLPYSSGTTGMPKGVVLTHYDLQCLLYNRHTLGAFRLVGRGDVVVMFLPFFHMSGFLGFVSTLHQGAKAVIMRQFDSSRYFAAVAKYKGTLVACVPLVFLAKDPSVDNFDLSSVREIIFGSAPAQKKLIELVMRRFPKVKSIFQGYGLTESGGGATITRRMPAFQYPLGSCGVCTSASQDIGELPTGYVALKRGYESSEETAYSIKSIVARHLAPCKHLRGGFFFVPELQKGTGKVLRRALKDIKSNVYAADGPNRGSKL